MVGQMEMARRRVAVSADRMDCNSEGHHKDTVCKAISCLRSTFEEPTDRTIRSHSGRQTMVNTLKASGLADDIAMYARISDKQPFHGYGSFTPMQASEFIKKRKALRTSVARVYGASKKKRGRKPALCRPDLFPTPQRVQSSATWPAKL